MIETLILLNIIILIISIISIARINFYILPNKQKDSKEIDIVETIQIIENYYKSRTQEKPTNDFWEEFITSKVNTGTKPDAETETKLEKIKNAPYDPSKVPGILDNMFKGEK